MGRAENPSTEKAVALFANLTPEKVYTPGGVDDVLRKITEEVRKTAIDVSTKAGRDAAKSLAYKVARSKTLLDDMGKGLVADWKTKASLVDAERKIIRDRLDALKDEVSRPVVEWEEAELDRVHRHVTAMTVIEELARFDSEPASEEIDRRLAAIEQAPPRDWQEFAEQAATVRNLALSKLAEMKAAALKREADAAELEALRAEKAERERKDCEQQEAREAEERARAADEARKRQEAESVARAEQAARDAVEAERQRVADQEAADRAAADKRERNKKHRAKIVRQTVEALVGCGITAEQAADVVLAIVDGKIPNITINF
jgi:hypothetical protein